MNERDIDRAARMLAASAAGTLTDITIFSMLLATRAEAVAEERERQIERLHAKARHYAQRHEYEKARVLAQTARDLTVPSPRAASAA